MQQGRDDIGMVDAEISKGILPGQGAIQRTGLCICLHDKHVSRLSSIDATPDPAQQTLLTKIAEMPAERVSLDIRNLLSLNIIYGKMLQAGCVV